MLETGETVLEFHLKLAETNWCHWSNLLALIIGQFLEFGQTPGGLFLIFLETECIKMI